MQTAMQGMVRICDAGAMGRKDRTESGGGKRRKRKAREEAASLARLERRLDELAAEHRALRKRLKRLDALARTGRARDCIPPWGPRVRGPGGRGRPPWVKEPGPVVSVEVPLETDDPGAPLWATVAARLPEEVTTVGDDGHIVRYRYSPVGSTPQAPRYRRLADPRSGP